MSIYVKVHVFQVTKCTFHKFGPSGTVQKFDGLCVLPLNIINEKIYVFLWFWFVILAIVTGIQVLELLLISHELQNQSQSQDGQNSGLR